MKSFLEWLVLREAEQKPGMDELDKEAAREGRARNRFYKTTNRARAEVAKLGGIPKTTGTRKPTESGGGGGKVQPVGRPGSGFTNQGLDKWKKD